MIGGTVLILIAFAAYNLILVKNAKREQECVPRMFAQYIAYTDSYLRQAEEYERLISEVRTRYFQFASKQNFQEELWDYISIDFMQKNPIPVIITDEAFTPLFWNRVGVSQDSLYSELSYTSKRKLQEHMSSMIHSKLTDKNVVTGYAFYAKPVSLQEFVSRVDYSIVVTDRDKQPLFWHNVGVPESQKYEEVEPEHRAELQEMMASMTEMPMASDADSLGYIYFTVPRSLHQIRNFVVLQLLIVLILIGFTTYGIFLLKRAEKDSLWMGLAKEIAHQFGTPITSLMGWLEYLKSRDTETPTQVDNQQILDMMATDVDHLKNIASRFGKVGSQAELKPTVLHDIMEETVDYFRKRMPHLGSRIDIHLISKIQGVNVMLDVELFKWSMENLIKNCVDAMVPKGGNIIITATQSERHVYLQIRDEGKGIPRSQWKKIFEPGVTSKHRGWGLGLSLAQRIIQDYHQGYIKVVTSTADEGTTMEIKLHKENREKDKS